MDSTGKLILESILETKDSTILQFLGGLRGEFLAVGSNRNVERSHSTGSPLHVDVPEIDSAHSAQRFAMLRFTFALFVTAATLICAVASRHPPSTEKASQVSLTYMGTAAWEISDGATVILIDPYLSRILVPPPGAGSAALGRVPGDTRPEHGWNEVVPPDVATIDSRIRRADFVLVTHTHVDHVMDVPHIALKTHAIVIGTESTENIMRAYNVPEDQLITVRGGEDYEFGKFSLKVIPSIHSALDHKHYFSSATFPSGMKAPLTLDQMNVEGGTVAYLIRFDGHQILAFGGMNYIEREIEGLTPDVVLVGASGARREIYDYTGRLMRDLHFPVLIFPTHWDNFVAPYEASQQPALDALQSFVQEVRAASPSTKVVVPKYFEPISLEEARK
jgi:L-ascorbate metabolism protein UlaG (beta-lactamase superfamily)